MQAEAIFTGSELLLGYVVNTHAHFLGLELAKMGIEMTLHTAVGDDWDRMYTVIKQALERSDLIITTGGLGPTTDDITKEVVAEALGVPMVMDEASLAEMRAFFDKRGRPMPALFARQACFPAGSRILPNHKGTAPGALIEHQGRIIVILPGPPRELRHMFKTSVEPYLTGIPGRGKVLVTTTLKLTGIAEYAVQELLKGIAGQGDPGLGYLAKPGETHVRISARHVDQAEAERLVAQLKEKVVSLVGDHVFAVDDEVPERIVGALLKEQGLTVAAAESCTAGLVAGRLANVPGSSEYLLGGLVTYTNEMKENLLGVPAETLARYGAVSEETAVAMVHGVRRVTGADFGVGVTGIAGPGGGSADKPVGLVYIAVGGAEQVVCRRFYFPGDRFAVRQGAVNASLQILRTLLEERARGNAGAV
ncbi:MAG: competence/damage-inducible protein A [Thermoanaerobacterales bacterium]|nr:competence/damage-inducible protein A [Bacillota bacterium]MDI6906610.1 competence/damage-inducible protein A [Thermoanaerobacterales bacterium]